MEFTIFYAWQSDRIEQDHHYFIRDAIEKAIKQIGKEPDVDESPRIDKDTKGLPGLPEIARTIFEKIEKCGVFVGDVTFVADTVTHNGRTKKTPNPNVTLELGYAASAVSWDRIILVMNDHFGSADEQIFDLKHRRWPILYTLPRSRPGT